tara:strand:- start:501 stop:629 length:129 start_codon:yes stop_codon:yes gene_type:complete
MFLVIAAVYAAIALLSPSIGALAATVSTSSLDELSTIFYLGK